MSIEPNKDLYNKIVESINDTNIVEEENIQVSNFNVSIPYIINHECYCSGTHDPTNKIVTVEIH